MECRMLLWLCCALLALGAGPAGADETGGYSALVPIPASGTLNAGLSPALIERLASADVGPFKVTGHAAPSTSLQRIFARVAAQL